jgi:hypothetical protein
MILNCRYALPINRIGDVLVSAIAESVVDHGFESLLGQTNDCGIGTCYFSSKDTALRRKVGSESG